MSWLEALPPEIFPHAARFMDVASLVALSKTSALLQANVTALDWKCTEWQCDGPDGKRVFADLAVRDGDDEEPSGCSDCGVLRCADCNQRCDQCGTVQCCGDCYMSPCTIRSLRANVLLRLLRRRLYL